MLLKPTGVMLVLLMDIIITVTIVTGIALAMPTLSPAVISITPVIAIMITWVWCVMIMEVYYNYNHII